MADLARTARDLARAWEAADAAAPPHPQYGKNGRGIGPYEEKPFVAMLHEHLLRLSSDYVESRVEVPYPVGGESADLCIGPTASPDLVLELKYARMKRSDGRMEEAALSRILSPYRESALVDCGKVLRFSTALHRGVVIVGYDYPDLPIEPLIEDFESLATKRVALGPATGLPL